LALMKIVGGLAEKVIAPNLSHIAFLRALFHPEGVNASRRRPRVCQHTGLTEQRAHKRAGTVRLMSRGGGILDVLDLWLIFADLGGKIGDRSKIARVADSAPTRRPLRSHPVGSPSCSIPFRPLLSRAACGWHTRNDSRY
jgi:hypothetical protein